ncbi:MAG: DUF5690 family protein [Flavobacteriaceae bacterium]
MAWFVAKKDFRVLLTTAYAAFGVYFCMYAFRKPFTVGTFEGQSWLGVDFKIVLIIAQVLGYMLSKFLGIKLISELKPQQRLGYLLGMIGVAELALILFGLLPAPYNIGAMFLNGLCLGMIWGIVFSYLEGRQHTEILGVALCSSFIVSSGAVKSVGSLVLNEMGISEQWMPSVTGAFFLILLFSFALLLNRIPAPNETDKILKSERRPMGRKERVSVFVKFSVPLTVLILFYVCLTALRDFRDNFSREIWDSLGYADNASIFTLSEVPIAILVLLSMGFLTIVKNNFRAFMAYHYLLLFGALLIGICSLMFQIQAIGPVFWMVCVGLGLYLCYVPFNGIFFDRMIATFRIDGNVGFLIYLADAFGYLGSVGVLLYKNFGQHKVSWLQFFIQASYVIAIIGALSTLISLLYFRQKRKNGIIADQHTPLVNL